MLGRRVEAIDRGRKVLALSSGGLLRYERLALAMGARVRRLALPDAARAEACINFHYLRTVDDVQRLRPQWVAGARLAIVGGGYIGLEVASAAIKQGLKVTLLEALPRVLARVTAPAVSAFYEKVHRAAGVDLRTGVALAGFEFDARGNRVATLICRAQHDDALSVPADLVVVGIGVVPNVEIAADAGLHVDNGIVVDEVARTSDHDIVAAGDCASLPNSMGPGRIRLESVPNAVGLARTAAATLCGHLRPYRSVPWFWSDQYDLKLQMVGLSQDYDEIVLRGDMARRSFAAFYLRGGCMIAVDAVNRPRDFMQSKRLVAAGVKASAAQLADESFDLKTLLPVPI